MLIDTLSDELLKISGSGYQDLFTHESCIFVLEEICGIRDLLAPVLRLFITLTVEEDMEALELGDFGQKLAEEIQANLCEAESEQARFALREIQNLRHEARQVLLLVREHINQVRSQDLEEAFEGA